MFRSNLARGLVVGLAALSMTACTGFDKLSDGDVDASQKSTALRIGTKLWQACKTGQHEALTEAEAIKEMREGLTPQKMASACASSSRMFGDFVSMDYAETWKPKVGSLRVYRFKGQFSNGGAPPEIRVVMDGSKLSGFWLKPWNDTLQ